MTTAMPDGSRVVLREVETCADCPFYTTPEERVGYCDHPDGDYSSVAYDKPYKCPIEAVGTLVVLKARSREDQSPPTG